MKTMVIAGKYITAIIHAPKNMPEIIARRAMVFSAKVNTNLYIISLDWQFDEPMLTIKVFHLQWMYWFEALKVFDNVVGIKRSTCVDIELEQSRRIFIPNVHDTVAGFDNARSSKSSISFDVRVDNSWAI